MDTIPDFTGYYIGANADIAAVISRTAYVIVLYDILRLHLDGICGNDRRIHGRFHRGVKCSRSPRSDQRPSVKAGNTDGNQKLVYINCAVRANRYGGIVLCALNFTVLYIRCYRSVLFKPGPGRSRGSPAGNKLHVARHQIAVRGIGRLYIRLIGKCDIRVGHPGTGRTI